AGTNTTSSPLPHCTVPASALTLIAQGPGALLHGDQPELGALDRGRSPGHVVSAGGGDVLDCDRALHERVDVLRVGVDQGEAAVGGGDLRGEEEAVAPPERDQRRRAGGGDVLTGDRDRSALLDDLVPSLVLDRGAPNDLDRGDRDL